MGKRYNGRIQNLRIAISSYRKALEIYNIKDYPEKYAEITLKLGISFLKLSQLDKKEIYLRKAIKNLNEALKILSKEASPIRYAELHRNLGNAYFDISELKEKSQMLKKAEKSYGVALNIYDKKNHKREIDEIKEKIKIIKGKAITRKKSDLKYKIVNFYKDVNKDTLNERREKKKSVPSLIDVGLVSVYEFLRIDNIPINSKAIFKGNWPLYQNIIDNEVVETNEIRKIIKEIQSRIFKGDNFVHLTADMASGKTTIISLLGLELYDQTDNWIVYFIKKGALYKDENYHEICNKLKEIDNFNQKNGFKSLVICEDVHLAPLNFESLRRKTLSDFRTTIHLLFISRPIFWDLLDNLQKGFDDRQKLKERFAGDTISISTKDLREKFGIELDEEFKFVTAEMMIKSSFENFIRKKFNIKITELKKKILNLAKSSISNKHSLNLYIIKFALMTFIDKGILDEFNFYDRIIEYFNNICEETFDRLLIDKKIKKETSYLKAIAFQITIISIFSQYEIYLNKDDWKNLELDNLVIIDLYQAGFLSFENNQIMFVHSALAELIIKALQNYHKRKNVDIDSEYLFNKSLLKDVFKLFKTEKHHYEKISFYSKVETSIYLRYIESNLEQFGTYLWSLRYLPVNSLQNICNNLQQIVLPIFVEDIKNITKGIHEIVNLLSFLKLRKLKGRFDSIILKNILNLMKEFSENLIDKVIFEKDLNRIKQLLFYLNEFDIEIVENILVDYLIENLIEKIMKETELNIIRKLLQSISLSNPVIASHIIKAIEINSISQLLKKESLNEIGIFLSIISELDNKLAKILTDKLTTKFILSKISYEEDISIFIIFLFLISNINYNFYQKLLKEYSINIFMKNLENLDPFEYGISLHVISSLKYDLFKDIINEITYDDIMDKIDIAENLSEIRSILCGISHINPELANNILIEMEINNLIGYITKENLREIGIFINTIFTINKSYTLNLVMNKLLKDILKKLKKSNSLSEIAWIIYSSLELSKELGQQIISVLDNDRIYKIIQSSIRNPSQLENFGRYLVGAVNIDLFYAQRILSKLNINVFVNTITKLTDINVLGRLFFAINRANSKLAKLLLNSFPKDFIFELLYKEQKISNVINILEIIHEINPVLGNTLIIKMKNKLHELILSNERIELNIVLLYKLFNINDKYVIEYLGDIDADKIKMLIQLTNKLEMLIYIFTILKLKGEIIESKYSQKLSLLISNLEINNLVKILCKNVHNNRLLDQIIIENISKLTIKSKILLETDMEHFSPLICVFQKIDSKFTEEIINQLPQDFLLNIIANEKSISKINLFLRSYSKINKTEMLNLLNKISIDYFKSIINNTEQHNKIPELLLLLRGLKEYNEIILNTPLLEVYNLSLTKNDFISIFEIMTLVYEFNIDLEINYIRILDLIELCFNDIEETSLLNSLAWNLMKLIDKKIIKEEKIILRTSILSNKLIEKALDIFPDNIIYLDTLACCIYIQSKILNKEEQNKRMKESLLIFEKIIKNVKNVEDISWDTVNEIYKKLGIKKSAYKIRDNILKRNLTN